MGCCQSQHKGKGIDRRNVIDHFMPPGAPQQPRFTYRLEKVEELDMEKLKSQNRIEMRNMASSEASTAFLRDRPIDAYENFDDEGAFDGEDMFMSPNFGPGQDSGAAAKAALTEAVGAQLQCRLGQYDAPVVGEERYLIVQTPVGAGSSECITRSCTLDEESLVREVQEEALKGLLFISNTLALVTYEIVGEGPQEGGGAVPTGQVLLEPLANDCGVDFERILDVAREKALAGWRLRGGLRGRAQVQDVVLEYAMFPDVVVSPFSHLVFSRDESCVRSQMELVELRGTATVITGTLLRIIRAWARRGWRLACVLYNIVTTYESVTLDPPEAGAVDVAGIPFAAPDTGQFGGGAHGELGLYYNVAIYFERRMAADDQGKVQAFLALQDREQAVQRGEDAVGHGRDQGTQSEGKVQRSRGHQV